MLIASLLSTIALLYEKMNKYQAALQYFYEELDLLEQSLPQNHRNIGICLNNIGFIYKNIEKHDEALDCFERALLIFKENEDFNNKDYFITISSKNMSEIYKNRLNHV